MIGGNTVFIVGAGASYELGLPVGDELKTIIAGLLNITFNDGYTRGSGDGAITQALREIVKDGSGRAGDINPYLHKCWRIRDALPMAISIDNFLDAHRGDTQMELCGKFGIVRAILEAERASKLKIFQNPRGEYQFSTLANTWYIPLFQLITENVDRNRIKSVFQKLSFIVFNYDRCLEYFLPFAISNYYDISLPDAEALVAQITFIHPYGQVGYLPWQKDGGNYILE